MSYKNKVFIVSLGILLVIAFLGYQADPPGGGHNQYAGVGYMAFMMIGIIIECIVLFTIGMILYLGRKKKPGIDADDIQVEAQFAELQQKANAYFLAMGLVLLVGASLCFGGAGLVYG